MSPIQASLQKIFVECLETILQPIVRFTLYCGLGHSEFAAASRRVFIDVATREFGVRGRPANAAKVAAKTGLPRKVIHKYRNQASNTEWTPDEEVSPLNTIIHYWRFDERFCTNSGNPRDLPLEGPSSFAALVKSCAGDIPVSTIRQELVREDIAEVLEDGVIRLKRDYSFPDRLDEDFLRNAAFSIRHHVETLLHNAHLVALDDDSHPRKIELGRFERLVWSRHLDHVGVVKFQQWVRENGAEFILDAEQEISGIEHLGDIGDTEQQALAGVGIFFFKAP